MNSSNIEQLSTPKTCSGCSAEHYHPRFATCDTCRERGRRRAAVRGQNSEPRTRGRPPLLPAATISQLHRLTPFDLGEMDQVCDHCGAKHWKAELSSSSTSINDVWMSCCKNGLVVIDNLTEPPAYIKDLFDDVQQRGRIFKENIRRYNAAFAFTSLRCNIHNHRVPNMPFQIHGEMYHVQGPLTPDNSRTANYAQLYIFDPMEASSIRLANNVGLDQDIIRCISITIAECNLLAQRYRSAHDMLSNADSTTTDVPFVRLDPTMALNLIAGVDRRTENLPSADEVAAIIPNEIAADTSREIRLYLRNTESNYNYSTISQNHALYMPSHYILLFPNGDLGWNWSLKLTNGKRLFQRAYYRYRLHQRDGEYPILFKAKRLFQQFVVDAWAICDQNKLTWLANHQSDIRADLYHGLEDALLQGDVDFATVGRRIVLPSSYTGGPSFMGRLYQNSMAIVLNFGKPSLFITFSANPRWIEIQRALYPGQTASDRPDLVSRVFDMKVKELLKDLKVRKIFGSYRGLVRTVEYQKRGLPHLHLLLFLDADHRLDTKEKIDEFISAELPSREDDQELYDIVTRNMVHGPCGAANPNSPCMVDDGNGQKRCSKNYPKAFNEETMVLENGYPQYKRTCEMSEATQYRIPNPVQRGGIPFEVDNRWIVPYNPYLSKKFKAHINVECCQGVEAIKYINKYVYKGSDRTTVRISDSNNEIDTYLQGRYVGPTEAFARLMEYKMHEEDPTVTTLILHLPGQQPVSFKKNATAEDIRRALEKSKSMLMGYFEYNANHPLVENDSNSQHYLYQDFPKHFTWNRETKEWEKRQRGTAIGRIPYCNPTSGERYYLRLLLTNVAGSASFEDLKRVNGYQHTTFKQACVALHLVEDDREWFRCLEEASYFCSGRSMRDLFILSLTFGQITDPVSLWNEFRSSICDDLDHKLQQLFPGGNSYAYQPQSSFYDGSPTIDYGLYLLQQILMETGHSLTEYQMPTSLYNWDNELSDSSTSIVSTNTLIDEQLRYNPQEERILYEFNYSLLNDDQRLAFDTIINGIELPGARTSNANLFYFLHGPAGTGKTFVYNTLCSYLRSQQKIVLCVASSGIASLLLSGGRTSHFRFKIPLNIDETSICFIKKNSNLAEMIRRASLIIWDEVPMQNKLCFEAVDRSLRDICDTDAIFGGIPTVLGGDFAQIPPVIKYGDRASIVCASIKNSYLWQHIQVLNLTVNMRVRGESLDDAHFKSWIQDISYNALMQNSPLSIPPYISQTQSLTDMISKIYPQHLLDNVEDYSEILYKSAILTTRNDNVDTLNNTIINLIPQQSLTMLSADTVLESGNDVLRISSEYLQTLNPPNFPPAKLVLKVGCIVMLLRNLNPSKGLCNGTRLIVKEIFQYSLKVSVLGRNSSEEQIEFIPRIELSTLEGEYPFILTRKQFPVKLSFAMTINKSQGQSLENVGIDLTIPVFTHGQLYVAFSRSTNVSGIHILLPRNADNRTVQNITYPELL